MLQDGEAALHYAASRGRANVVELLLERGADTAAKNIVSVCNDRQPY